MKILWLFTLKHTGTHYTFAHLDKMGYVQARIDVKSGDFTHQGHFCHLHVEEPNHFPLRRYDQEGPVVVTLRNPVEVHISWLARYGVAESTTEALVNSYTKYQAVIDQLNPHIFKVDHENIEAEVGRLREYLCDNDLPPMRSYRYEYIDPSEHRGHRGRRHNFPDAYKYETPESIIQIAEHYGYTSPIRNQQCIS